MNSRYFFHILLSLPLIPLIILQAKKMRRKIPILPEAENIAGCISGSSSRTINLLFLGESSVAGVGVKTHEESMVGNLCEMIASNYNATVYWEVLAKSKYNALKIFNYLIPQVKDHSIDLVLIGTGGNDSFELTRPKLFKKHLLKIINFMEQEFPEVPILFIHFPPVASFPAFSSQMHFVLGKHTEILSEELKDLISEKDNIYFMSDNMIFKKWAAEEKVSLKEFFSDGIHPSRNSYKKWASEIEKFIIEHKILE